MLSTLRYWAMSLQNIDRKIVWTWFFPGTSTIFSNMCWSCEFFNLRDMSKTVAWLYIYIYMIKIKIKAKMVFTRFQLRAHVPLVEWFLDMELTKCIPEAILCIVRKLGKTLGKSLMFKKYLDVIAGRSSKTTIISLTWVPSIENGRVEKGLNTWIYPEQG